MRQIPKEKRAEIRKLLKIQEPNTGKPMHSLRKIGRMTLTSYVTVRNYAIAWNMRG